MVVYSETDKVKYKQETCQQFQNERKRSTFTFINCAK